MHLSTALVGTIASKPQLGFDHQGRHRCYVKVRQTVWDTANRTSVTTTYSDMIVTSRAAHQFATRFGPGDGFIAQGEAKTSRSGTTYFLAHRVAADPHQSSGATERTSPATPIRAPTSTPKRPHPTPRSQPDLAP